jgi:hypothetical protein
MPRPSRGTTGESFSVLAAILQRRSESAIDEPPKGVVRHVDFIHVNDRIPCPKFDDTSTNGQAIATAFTFKALLSCPPPSFLSL